MFSENMKYTNVIVQVGKQGFCYWDYETEMKRKNIEFIKSIDTSYFTYQADVHSEKLETEHNSSASLALRSAYVHGLETLFSLIAGLIQAPLHLHFWSSKYQINELREIVKSLNYNYLDVDIYKTKNGIFDWNSVAEIVFMKCNNDAEILKSDKEQFAQLWQRFGYDFCDEDIQTEYNSVKHGFRAKQGGFGIEFGIEDAAGAPVPQGSMIYRGTKCGSSFYVPKLMLLKAHDNNTRNLEIIHKSLAWDPENIYYGLHHIAFSIDNIKSALLIINGIDPTTVDFKRFLDYRAFNLPWEISTGIIAMESFRPTPPYGRIEKLLTKEEIRERITARKMKKNDL